MNPQATQQQNAPFLPQHNQIYNNLRDAIMQYHAQGVPGMDQLAQNLNKVHTNLMQNYVPPQQQQRSTTQPAATTQSQNKIAAMNDLMNTIRQKNTPTLPNGFGAYQ